MVMYAVLVPCISHIIGAKPCMTHLSTAADWMIAAAIYNYITARKKKVEYTQE